MFYLDLFRELEREGVRYLLVGGLALNIHGVERATMDVDLALALDGENLERFLRAAENLGLKPMLPVPLTDLVKPAIRQDWIEHKHMVAFALRPPAPTAPTVDILIATNLDFEAAYARRLEKDLGGLRLSLAGLDDLIAMKRGTGRSRDEADIEAMEKLRRLGLA